MFYGGEVRMRRYLRPVSLVQTIAVMSLGGLSVSARAEFDPALFNLSLAELAEIPVAAASRAPQALADVPASVTVFTAEDILLMGARDIYDVLRMAPGLRLGQTNRGRTIVGVRGIRKNTSDSVLFKLNGHNLTEPAYGSAIFLADIANVPLAAIKRIEVIRGPSSAIHGANAFLAVVNIITKDAADVDGTEVSFRTEMEKDGNIGQTYNASVGQTFSNGSAFYLTANLVDRSGPELYVPEDRIGVSGYADTDYRQADVLGRYTYGPLSLGLRYAHQDRGEMFGLIDVLSPESQLTWDSVLGDVSFDFQPTDDLKLSLRGYGDFMAGETFAYTPPAAFPEGSPFRAIGESATLSLETAKLGLESGVTYTRWDRHTLSLLAFYEHQRQDDVTTVSNNDGSGQPLPEPRDVSATKNFGRDAHRDLVGLLAEDIWRVSDAVLLNAGLRLDSYSDFGESLNPRLGATWALAPDLALKLNYGTAFRAPDFRSLYLESPFIQGNEDLTEEKVESYEVAVEKTFAKKLFLRAAWFHNELTDLITIPPGELQYQNSNEASSQGVELEGRLTLTDRSRLIANYTYTDSTLNETAYPDEPMHSGSVMFNTTLLAHLEAGLSSYWQTDAARGAVDSRADLPGYGVINLTLLSRGWRNGLSYEFSIYNLMDEDYAYASPVNTIPGDYPAPGRSFLVEFTRWPESSLADAQSPVRIGILGRDADGIGASLKAAVAALHLTIQGRALQVESYPDAMRATDARGLDVLLVTRDAGPALTAVRPLFAHQPTLLVGEGERDRMAMAVEQAAEAVIITDPEGLIQYVNPAFTAVSGYRRAETLGKTPRILKSGRQHAQAYNDLWATIKAGLVWKGHLVNQRKDGSLYDQDTIISPLKNADGVISNFVAVCRDVSRETSLHEQLVQSQKMEAVGKLAGGVAHDFNNLLMIVLNNAIFVRDALPEDSPPRADLDEIIRTAHRGADLTRQLLAFSRQQILESRVADLNEVVEGFRKMMGRLIGEDIRIEVQTCGEALPVKVDVGQFDQVLMNLAVNARDAMPKGGTLTISLAKVADCPGLKTADGSLRPCARVVVQDTGVGIAPAVKERILTYLGYTVQCASSAPEAMAFVKSGLTIDLMVADVVMPGMDGVSLAKQARGVRPELPVLFLSGYPQEKLAEHGILQLHDPLVSKPCSAYDLAFAVRGLLDKRGAE